MSTEKMIENILGEHYNSFFMIAYDETGNCIVMKNIHNQLEFDAMICAITKEIRTLSNDDDSPSSDEEQIRENK